MKKSLLLAVSASLALAACGQQAEKAEAPQDQAAANDNQGITVIAKVGEKAEHPVYTKTSTDKLALSGFDAVSYFKGDGTPQEGKGEFTVVYQDFEYRFASKENADEFAADPAKFAPQYGGYCAWATANGKLAPGNPQNYKIVDGKLYLNFSDTVQETWEKDVPGFIKKADEEYPKFKPEQRYDDA